MSIRRLIISVLISINFDVFAASNVDPVSIAIGRLNVNDIDTVEFAYVGIRCGALNNVIGMAFQSMGSGSDRAKEIEKQYLNDAEAFKNVGFTLAVKSNQSNKYVLDQFQFFLKYYGDEWMSGHKSNNNAWTKLIAQEVESCQKVTPLFNELSQIITENNSSKDKLK